MSLYYLSKFFIRSSNSVKNQVVQQVLNKQSMNDLKMSFENLIEKSLKEGKSMNDIISGTLDYEKNVKDNNAEMIAFKKEFDSRMEVLSKSDPKFLSDLESLLEINSNSPDDPFSDTKTNKKIGKK